MFLPTYIRLFTLVLCSIYIYKIDTFIRISLDLCKQSNIYKFMFLTFFGAQRERERERASSIESICLRILAVSSFYYLDAAPPISRLVDILGGRYIY